MTECPKCGVESNENANFCTVCGEPLHGTVSDFQTSGMSGRIGREEKILTEYQALSGIQKRKIFWKISGLVLLCALFITLIIDYVSTGSVTWSRYPATISLVLFINITLNTFLHNNWLPLAGLSFLSLALLFILFDLYAEETGWKTGLGISVLFVAYVTVFSLVYLVKSARQKGLNVIAWSLLAAGILCLCTEALISIYRFSYIHLGWSLIAAVSAFMIALLLLYIHYRLKKATDLKRFFHI